MFSIICSYVKLLLLILVFTVNYFGLLGNASADLLNSPGKASETFHKLIHKGQNIYRKVITPGANSHTLREIASGTYEIDSLGIKS